MSRVHFHKEPVLMPNAKGRKFMLDEPFICMVGAQCVTIPEGFWTDLASIPPVFRSVISPLDKHLKAAILHDYLYYMQRISIFKLNRKEVDVIFLNGMVTCNVGWLKRKTMYYAVRSFGWLPWNKYKNNKKKLK